MPSRVRQVEVAQTLKRVKSKVKVSAGVCMISSTWRVGRVAGEKVIHLVPDGSRPSAVHNKVEGIGKAAKLSAGIASEKKVEEIVSCQFTVE